MTFIVHGESKAGKSTLANTSPAPRLLLDVEMAYRFLSGRKIAWDPHTEAPPVYDGTWDTAVVIVRSYADVRRAVEWLQQGDHQFKSVVLDSISELQTLVKEQLDASGKMTMQLWGSMLFEMDKKCRELRDLPEHPTNPVEAVVITAQTSLRDGKYRPYMQGQMKTKLPYYFDVIGFLAAQKVPQGPDYVGPDVYERKLCIGPHDLVESGSRVVEQLGNVVDDPNITTMLDKVFPPVSATKETKQ